MGLVIRAGELFTPERIAPGLVVIENEKVSYSGPWDKSKVPAGAELIEAADKWAAPGLVDVHIHGGAGADALRDGLAGLERTAKFLVTHGVTSFLPSTPSATMEQLAAATEQVRKAQNSRLGLRSPFSGEGGAGAEILGIHLEGPYLAPTAKGAHDPAFLKIPSIADCEKLLAIGQGAVKMITLAPELEGAAEFTRWITGQGVVVSLGHSKATYQQAKEVIDAGATHATHLFNTMPDLQKREPGLVGALLEDERVYVELIADLVHVHPMMLKLAISMKGAERTVLVSDAIEAGGMPDGQYELSGLAIEVKNGVALLANSDTLAGSTLTLDRAIKNIEIGVGRSRQEAVTMATKTAADSLGLSNKGRLYPGADGDLVLFNPDHSVALTVVKGEIVYRG
jgi:N-acetylglucosamine-6-phosphate deacetylase